MVNRISAGRIEPGHCGAASLFASQQYHVELNQTRLSFLLANVHSCLCEDDEEKKKGVLVGKRL